MCGQCLHQYSAGCLLHVLMGIVPQISCIYSYLAFVVNQNYWWVSSLYICITTAAVFLLVSRQHFTRMIAHHKQRIACMCTPLFSCFSSIPLHSNIYITVFHFKFVVAPRILILGLEFFWSNLYSEIALKALNKDFKREIPSVVVSFTIFLRACL